MVHGSVGTLDKEEEVHAFEKQLWRNRLAGAGREGKRKRGKAKNPYIIQLSSNSFAQLSKTGRRHSSFSFNNQTSFKKTSSSREKCLSLKSSMRAHEKCQQGMGWEKKNKTYVKRRRTTGRKRTDKQAAKASRCTQWINNRHLRRGMASIKRHGQAGQAWQRRSSSSFSSWCSCL